MAVMNVIKMSKCQKTCRKISTELGWEQGHSTAKTPKKDT
jgi:hypothetical protein